MKIFILTEGGKNMGFGHLTRSIALLQAIKESYSNIETEFVFSGDSEAEKFIEILQVDGNVFDWHMNFPGILDKLKPENVVIIDSYLAEENIYNSISSIVSGKLVMIDDYNRIEYPKGIVVNPSIYGDKLDYSQKDGVTYLLGKDYIILRKEFWNVPEKRNGEKVKEVLITFGGMISSDFYEKIADFLKSRFKFNISLVNPEKEKLKAEKVLELILKADICISGGGQTTYELARVGTPAVGICFAENQLDNLMSWSRNGFMEYIGWYTEEDMLDKLEKAIILMLSEDERKKRSKIGRSCVDGKGAERIVNEALKG